MYDANPCSALKDLSGEETGNPLHIIAEKIESNQTIQAVADVKYDAKDYVLLKEGFSVVAGADFHAYIQGCTSSALQEEAVSRRSAEEVVEVQSKQDIEKKYVKVFPNPVFSGETLSFETDSNLPLRFQLYAVTGQQMVSQIVIGSQSIQLPALAGGIYIYKIENQEIGEIGQLVVQH